MANRFTNISTSSFKPLSLDEIMAVPLAKQAQHDASMLALDEFSKMEANSLDKDKEYVSGQIQAFQKESDDIANDLLDNGVNRSLKNKIKGLRSRKNVEFSLQGKTGQASAAYNQFKANEKSIMARKDLTEQQKTAGLAKAKNDYLGVAEGGQYQDYVGTSHIDIMEKGRKIASQMTPEEKAGALGMTYNETTGMYSDGTYTFKTLKPEHIQKVVYQGLKNDRLVQDYTNELQELGIEEDADEMIKQSAISAGNVYQVSSTKTAQSLLPGFAQKKKADASEGMIDTTQPWNSMHLENMDAAFNYQYDMIDEDTAQDLFNPDTGQVVTFNEKYDAELGEKREKAMKMANDMKKSGAMDYKAYQQQMMAISVMYPDQKKGLKAAEDLKAVITNLKTDNPNLNELSDRAVFDLYNEAKKRSVKSFAQVVKPMNPKSTYKALETNLIGSGDKSGDIMQKTVKTSDGKTMAYNELFESDEYDHLDKNELNAAIRSTGKVLGFAPGHIDMPGASVVQFEDPNGDIHILYVEADDKESKAFAGVAKMNKAIIDGQNYSHENVGGRHEHIITELSQRSGKYEAAIIRAQEEIPNEELRELEWTYANNPNYPGALISEYNGNPVLRYNFDDEVQRSTNKVTNYYDETPNASQGLSKEQKN
mgnify:FL=1